MDILLKRLINCKKGVAEVIGSLIIILIVAVAGVVVYAYSLNVMSSSSSNFNLQSVQREQQAQERFQILRVWSNQNQFNVTILNHGQTDLTVAAVYLNGTASTQYTGGKDTTIGVGQLVNVKFTSPITVQSGSTVQILAVSERGGKTTVLYEA